MKQLAFFCYHILFKFKHVYFTDKEIHIFLKPFNIHTQNIFYTTFMPKCYNKNRINFNTNVQHDCKYQSG
jgi:hypothetical protein